MHTKDEDQSRASSGLVSGLGFFGGAGHNSTVGVVALSMANMLPANILRQAVSILWPRDVAPRAVPSASSAARRRSSISVSDRGLWSSIVA